MNVISKITKLILNLTEMIMNALIVALSVVLWPMKILKKTSTERVWREGEWWWRSFFVRARRPHPCSGHRGKYRDTQRRRRDI